MGNKRNYKNWYIFSLVLYAVAVLVHMTGYFTNVLYVAAWVLWMPVIALMVVCVFDVKNSTVTERNKIFSGIAMKKVTFIVLLLSAVYVIFNLIYCFAGISGISDIQTVNGAYYAIGADGVREQIGYDEYVRYSLAGFRMLSGHMLVFIAAPLWYFGEKKNV